MVKKNKEIWLNDKSIKSYFKDILKCKPISREEEFDLYNRYKNNNDIKARDKIITSNLKFVASIAKKYQGMGLSYSDLIAEGNIGLIKALDKFDIGKGYKFISYGVWWIKQSILEALNKRNSIEAEDLPTDKESVDIINDEDIFKPNSMIMEDTLCYDESNKLKIDEELKALEILMGNLSDREREILTYYYGLDGKKPKTLDEIGEILNLTKERIRQINCGSFKKMRVNALNNFINSDIYK